MMNLKLITKIGTIAISLLSVIFLVTIITADEEGGGMLEPIIYLAYLVLGLAISLSLFFSIKNLASKKGPELKRTFIGFGAFLGVILISFVLADSTVFPMKDGEELSSSASRLVSTGLNAFYALFIVAIVLMFGSGLLKIKK